MTCGYVCPVCEGRTILEDGRDCDYCTQPGKEKEKEKEKNSIAPSFS
ncbi:MAG: hypothetical protein Q8R57_06830 [Bacteroidota bacterium]|nr:hypothetical protein [Bacteroidota bacterium]